MSVADLFRNRHGEASPDSATARHMCRDTSALALRRYIAGERPYRASGQYWSDAGPKDRNIARVAQLNRAPVYETGGRRFESCLERQFLSWGGRRKVRQGIVTPPVKTTSGSIPGRPTRELVTLKCPSLKACPALSWVDTDACQVALCQGGRRAHGSVDDRLR